MVVVSIHLDRSNTDSIYYYIFFMCTDSTYRYHFFYVQVTFACGFYFSVIKLFCNVHAHALEHVDGILKMYDIVFKIIKKNEIY